MSWGASSPRSTAACCKILRIERLALRCYRPGCHDSVMSAVIAASIARSSRFSTRRAIAASRHCGVPIRWRFMRRRFRGLFMVWLLLRNGSDWLKYSSLRRLA